MCDKRFKSQEFVQKHVLNKHDDELDKKFNLARFQSMMLESYMADPHKFIN